MTAWLTRNGFGEVSKHTVDRLMRDEGMNGLVRGRSIRTRTPAKDGGRRAAATSQRRIGDWSAHPDICGRDAPGVLAAARLGSHRPAAPRPSPSESSRAAHRPILTMTEL